MSIVDKMLGKKKITPPKYEPKQEEQVDVTMTKQEEDYREKYEKLKKEMDIKDSVVEPETQPEKKEQTQEDIDWFYVKYGATFQAQQPEVNNETVMINLLYGCLIELKQINEKLSL